MNKAVSTQYFSTLLPPPNLTGVLHLGHIWNATIQDCLMRYHHNIPSYWLFGVDHAGLSLQIKFDQELIEQGICKKGWSDAHLMKEMEMWKNKKLKTIIDQFREMNFLLSKDVRYTQDQHSVQFVKQTFVDLFNRDLIYRAKKIIHWDVSIQAPISKYEIIYKQEPTSLIYLKYQIGEQYLLVATTRVETIFADVALFVHPSDIRYKEFIGKMATVPITGHKIPILSDKYVDIDFGSGVLKCTPAHDFEDHKLMLKYKLDILECISGEGFIINAPWPYEGLGLDVCKTKLIQELQNQNLIERTEDYMSNIPYSSKTDHKIIPLLSTQWFLKSSQLAQQAIVHLNKIHFHPHHFIERIKQCFLEMEDWCISRQIKWGIPIPIFYTENKMIASCEKIDGIPETDVLDTWFSSALWPLITFKYAVNPSLRDMFPLTVLVTGKDILMPWVSRMMFLSLHLEGRFPFEHVYLHGMLLDNKHKKMSKSENNGIDPRDIAGHQDALKMFLLSGTGNISFDIDKLLKYERFIHKVKHAHKFIQQYPISIEKVGTLLWFEKQIFYSWQKSCEVISNALASYQFNLAVIEVMCFIKEEFCNQYLELFKLSPKSPETIYFLHSIWASVLIMLEPFAPLLAYELNVKKNVSNPFAYKASDTDIQLWTHFKTYLSIMRNLNLFNSQVHIQYIPHAHSSVDELVVKQFMQEISPYLKIINQEIHTAPLPSDVLIIHIEFMKFFVIIPREKILDSKLWIKKEIIRLEAEVKRSEQIMKRGINSVGKHKEYLKTEHLKQIKYMSALQCYKNIDDDN